MSKRRLNVVLLSSVLVGSLFAASAGVVLAATPIYVGGPGASDANAGSDPLLPKATINAGIGVVDVGGTVIVRPGTYPEHVVINKDITLLGNNSGNTCLQLPRNAESTITGNVAQTGAVQILSDGVTFSGFSVTLATPAPSPGLQAGIHVANTISGYDVNNNWISGNQIGMFADSDGASWVQCNFFDNNNVAGSSGGTAIYSDSSVSLTVDNNRFTNHNINIPVYFDTSLTAPFVHHVNLTFTDNILDNFWSGTAFFGVNGGEIARNDIQALEATLIEIGGASSNVSIHHNILHNGQRGVRIEDLGIGLNVNIDVNRNSITNIAGDPLLKEDPTTFGVGNVSGQTANVDATCNWWGSATGPGPVGPGGGAPVTTGVDFTPWLASADLDGACEFDTTSVTKTHSGDFLRFGFGTYKIKVGNPGGGPTSGLVTVVDDLPTGLHALRLAGAGWDCDKHTLTCWRDDPLAAGGTYPTITLTVFVSWNAPSEVINRVTVSGGGDLNPLGNTAEDPTTIRSWLSFRWMQPA